MSVLGTVYTLACQLEPSPIKDRLIELCVRGEAGEFPASITVRDALDEIARIAEPAAEEASR